MRGTTLVQTARRYGVPGLVLLARYYALQTWAGFPGPDRHSCPLCGWTGPRFGPFLVMPEYVREGAACPGCGALERHRALGAFLAEEVQQLRTRLGRPLDVLHLTPEPSLAPVITPHARAYDRSQYDTPVPPGFLRVDLCDTGLPESSYDLIVANGILSCVPDVPRALAEIHRVLRPGGAFLGHEHIQPGHTMELTPYEPGDPIRPSGLQRIFGADDLSALAPDAHIVDLSRRFSGEERTRFGLIAPTGASSLTALVIRSHA